MTFTREAILDRIRAAQREAKVRPGAAKQPSRPTRASRPGSIDLLGQRLREFGACVEAADEVTLPAALADWCRSRMLGRVLLAPALAEFAPAIEHAVVDGPQLSRAEIAASSAAVTGCALAIADTGTLVLDGGARSGRRMLSLLPDWHLCVIAATEIVPTLHDAGGALRRLGTSRRPLTLVSGPSATSDIELERVVGVHGPRNLVAWIVS